MGARWPSGLDRALAWPWAGDRTLSRNPAAATSLRNFPSLAIPFTPLCQCLSEETLKAVAHDQSLLSGVYIGFTVTSYAVSRGHPAPLVGKRFLAGGLHVYFCLDSCLVYIINFAHTQDHDYVLYIICVLKGTSGIVWMTRFSLLSYKKWKTKKMLVECVQLLTVGRSKFQQ